MVMSVRANTIPEIEVLRKSTRYKGLLRCSPVRGSEEVDASLQLETLETNSDHIKLSVCQRKKITIYLEI